MIAQYKYRLVNDKGWYFELLPNNSNRIYTARSSTYPTKERALLAIEQLKSFLDANGNVAYRVETICSVSFPNDTAKYRGVFVFSEKGDEFATRAYCQHSQVQVGIDRILTHYNSLIRTDLEEKR